MLLICKYLVSLVCGKNRVSCLDRMREPHVTSDHTVITDTCVTAEYRCARIDNDIVSDIGMTLDTFYQRSVAPG